MKPLPKKGIWGLAALREAAAGSFQQIMRLIETQLRTALTLSGETDVYPYVVALFPDSVVVNKESKLIRYDYKVVGDKAVELSNPIEVIETFKPVEAPLQEAVQGAFIEADEDGGGNRWRIRIIKAGLSGNGNFYPDTTLKAALPMFEGVRVFVKADAEHLAGGGKDFNKLIGRITAPVFVEGEAPDTGELQGVFEVLESAGNSAAKIREAYERGMADIFGFSIDARGTVRAGKIGGRKIRVATKFIEVKSVDLIVEPGAGGQVLQLIEAKQEASIMDRDEIIALIEAKKPDLLKDKNVAELSDDDVKALLTEALGERGEAHAGQAATAAAGTAQAAGGEGDPAPLTRDDVTAMVRMTEARAAMRTTVAASRLPELARQRLTARFEGAESFTEAEVADAIKAEAEYLAAFTESGAVVDLGEGSRIEAGEGRPEKVAQMFDAMFDPEDRSVRSLKECYIEVTGDTRITGMLRDANEATLRESLLSSSFSNVLGDSIARRVIADYNVATDFDIWRQLTGNPVPVNDFRTNERTRWGGYGDLPIVAESDPYTALASPGDEKVTYAVAKRGGTEDVTLEMIKNDDVGAVMRIPGKLTRAAKRTLSKFVLDFIKDNPVIYDALALFHATHNNLGSAALDATSFAAARLAVKQQAEFGTSDAIGVGPKFLWVPDDLEETAVNLFNRNTNLDKTFIQTLSPTIIPVWYWTDANDWAASVDPADVPTVEIGFLDGQEEPELFVQDSPTVGSMFTNDKVTYKIRHIYGGNVIDFRGMYKGVVA